LLVALAVRFVMCGCLLAVLQTDHATAGRAWWSLLDIQRFEWLHGPDDEDHHGQAGLNEKEEEEEEQTSTVTDE